MHKTLVVIAGPTAVGKTKIAIEVAKYLNAEIISADSRQFYKELKIGTAPPSSEQLNCVKHHFIGNISIGTPYDVSTYENEALKLINSLFKNNNFIVLVGGSGLYIKTLVNGLDNLPESNSEVRSYLQSVYLDSGIEKLRSMLKILDYEYYNIVDLANHKRLLRALEVCLSTGKTFTSFRLNSPLKRNFNVVNIALNLPRNELHDNINRRVDIMIEDGLIDEVKSLIAYRHLNSLNTVGYKELFDYFDNKISLNNAIEKIKTNTRRYARRQITWLRKETEYIWLQPDIETIIKVILSECKKKKNI